MTAALAIALAPASPAAAVQPRLEPVAIELEQPADTLAREALLDRAFGPARFGKTCERLRAGRRPADGLSLIALARDDGGERLLVGTVRLWHVDAGGVPALMLGPLAVDARWRCHGIGGMLIAAALARAAALGHRAVLLVGDAPYYARFGFERRFTRDLRLPGPVDAERFLGLELAPGALAGAKGAVEPTGAVDLSARRRHHRARLRRAA